MTYTREQRLEGNGGKKRCAKCNSFSTYVRQGGKRDTWGVPIKKARICRACGYVEELTQWK